MSEFSEKTEDKAVRAPEGGAKEGYVKGSLTQVPFPKVLNFINQAGKSGILALSQGKRKVHIHFDRGEIVYVTSSYFPEMSLGEYLVKEGKITQEVREQSIENTRQDKVKQGTYLVEKGFISPHELYEALHNQVTRKLFKLFSWTDGEFFFREGEIITEEHRILNISFPNLLYRGIRSHLPLDKPPIEFRGRKEDLLVKRFAGRYRIEDLKLGPAETRLYNFVNGERTLRQIVALASISKAAAYKVIYALFLLELVGFPEAFRSDRITQQGKEKREPAAPRAEGYEIQISNDILADAMAAVDRARESTKQEEDEAPRRPAAAAPTAGGYAYSFAAPAAPPPAESPKRSAPEREEAPPAETPAVDFAPAPPAALSDDLFQDAALEKSPPPGAPADEAPAAFADSALPEEVADKLMMDVDDYTNADDLIKQAGYLLDDGNWSAARRFLTKAVELDENNADAYALLGWAVFNDSANAVGRAEGERTVKKGMKLAPGRFLHFLYLGKIYAAQEQFEFAELHFIKALELNVECSEAREEIKRIRNR
jgi:tetratricopeptide (TPR) repeat protein